MITNTISDGNNQYSYLPYFTRNPMYLYPSRYKTKDIYEVSVLSNSEIKPTPNKDLLCESSLEDLIFKKGELVDARIEMLITDIQQRRKIKEDNLYWINYNQCTCRNLINKIYHPYIWDKKKVDMEKKIIDLEEEKRKEETGYFKDILFLKKELRDTLIEKLEEKQKMDLLSTQQEE